MHVRRQLFLLLTAAGMTIGCDADAARCFAPGTALPDRTKLLQAPGVGESAARLADALANGDADSARALLASDPALARVMLGDGADMLTLAVAGCSREAVDLVIEHGAKPDGQGGGLPLILALRATDDWFAQRLLRAGASSAPPGAPTMPMRTAIGLSAPDRVAMLLDARADPNMAERTGTRPLHTALDMERFRIAELLLDRGADPWAIDAGGANLATSVATPMLTDDAREAAAQRRLAGRVSELGWPAPAPSPRAIQVLAIEGRWPPPDASAPPVPEAVLALIRERAGRR